MINFSSEPYEWQKHMNIVIENVNLEEMNILDHATIQLRFLDCYKGKPYKVISCHSVWKYIFETSGVNEFPLFIGDVRVLNLKNEDIQSSFNYLKYGFSIPESEEFNLVCIDSGEVSISIICGKVGIADAQ